MGTFGGDHDRVGRRGTDLTEQQYKFCLIIAASELTYHQAYCEAFEVEDSSGTWQKGKASTLMKMDKIKKAIKGIIDEKFRADILTKKERLQVLSKIAIVGDKFADRLKAIDILNKMSGDYIEKHEIDIKATVKYHNMDEWYDENGIKTIETKVV